jgi:hypothetical protein
LQLALISADGTAAEKSLLADVTAKHPDATYIELLRLFKVRRSVPDGHSQRACCICACCALPAHVCAQLPHATVTCAARICTATAHSLLLGGGGFACVCVCA